MENLTDMQLIMLSLQKIMSTSRTHYAEELKLELLHRCRSKDEIDKEVRAAVTFDSERPGDLI